MVRALVLLLTLGALADDGPVAPIPSGWGVIDVTAFSDRSGLTRERWEVVRDGDFLRLRSLDPTVRRRELSYRLAGITAEGARFEQTHTFPFCAHVVEETVERWPDLPREVLVTPDRVLLPLCDGTVREPLRGQPPFAGPKRAAHTEVDRLLARWTEAERTRRFEHDGSAVRVADLAWDDSCEAVRRSGPMRVGRCSDVPDALVCRETDWRPWILYVDAEEARVLPRGPMTHKCAGPDAPVRSGLAQPYVDEGARLVPVP